MAATSINDVFSNKSLKPKEKVETLGRWLLDKTIAPDELVAFAQAAKTPVKASCMEALEFASRQQPGLITQKVFSSRLRGLQPKRRG